MDSTTTPPSLADLVKGLRKEAKLSQTAAATHAGCSPDTWREVEAGARLPRPDDLGRFLTHVGAGEDSRGAIAAAFMAEAGIVEGRQAPAEGEG